MCPDQQTYHRAIRQPLRHRPVFSAGIHSISERHSGGESPVHKLAALLCPGDHVQGL